MAVRLFHKNPDSTADVWLELDEKEGKVLLDEIIKRVEAYKLKE